MHKFIKELEVVIMFHREPVDYLVTYRNSFWPLTQFLHRHDSSPLVCSFISRGSVTRRRYGPEAEILFLMYPQVSSSLMPRHSAWSFASFHLIA